MTLLWQTPFVSFLQNPLGYLTAHGKSLLPVVLIAGVLLIVACLLLKKLKNKLIASSTHKKTGPEFPATEASFRAVFDESTFGAALLDRAGRVLHANQTFQEMLGNGADQLVGQPLSNFAHPEDAHADKAPFTELLEGHRRRYVLERRFYQDGGKVLWLCEEVFAPQGGDAAQLQTATPGTRAIALFTDITRRRLAEDELQITREAIHNLYQVIVDRDLDLLAKIRALLNMGCRRFGVETGVLGEIVPGGFELLEVVSPDERLRRGKVYERSTEMGDWPEPVFARNTRLPDSESTHLERDWRRFPFYSVADVDAFLSVPVYASDELFGVLCFSGVAEHDEPYSTADKEYMQLMAQWLGGELERLEALTQLEVKQQELVKANAQLEALATVDALTGAKNRRALEEQLEMELRRARRYSTPLSLLLLDVDKFKEYNDTYGHPEGDAILKDVAEILHINVRAIDFVARYGGEEFAVLLPQTDVEGAMIVSERLREKIESAKWPSRAVTASFGIATLTDEMKERSELIAAADRALYVSKDQGRNRSTHVRDVEAKAVEQTN